MRLADRIRAIVTTAGAVVQRFPSAFLLCTYGALCAIWAIESTSLISEEIFFRVLFCCILGMPLTIGLTLATEGSSSPWLRRLPEMSLVPLMAFAVRFVLLPDRLPETEGIRLATLILAAHLSVAVIPFLRRPGDDRYWAFQVRLFLRFLLGGLYAGVLFVGLALALLSLDRLLDLDINDKRYPQLWFIMAGVFHPLFTLGGIGRVADESTFEASIGLRKFVQFALLPLTALYLLILYLYAGKIVLRWELPNGWVGLPVLILTVVGILGALLLHPWSADPATPWVRRFTRGFFALTLPLTGLLALSIGVRISDYGVTEPRYYVVILTGWLVVLCLIRARQPHRDLRLIPASLCGLALLGSFGPWSATSWSLHSQQNRVEKLLATLGLQSNDGTFTAFDAKAAPDQLTDAQSLQTTLRYLDRSHGAASLPASLRQDGRSVIELMTHLALDRLQINANDVRSRYYRADGFLRVDLPAASRVYVVDQLVRGRVDPVRCDGWLFQINDNGLSILGPRGAHGLLTADRLLERLNPDAKPTSEDLTYVVELSDQSSVTIAFRSVSLDANAQHQPAFINAQILLAVPAHP